MSKIFKAWPVISIACAACFASPAAANTDDMPIQADVVSRCAVSATSLDFGVLDIATIVRKDANATITVTCSGIAIFRVELDNGTNAASGGQRRLVNGKGDHLTYEVYRNGRRTQRWGAGPFASRNGIILSLGSGSVDLEAYGRLSGITPATATGTYTDTLTVTVVL